ncbi:hypothetical protein RvY_10504-2 [Ramazzottius varieornatus]|uniref:C2H2-type domain-containing protein n=1 Tax=Ramazzottius varieornatus TaxID=947166 RepID=A0A1D1VHG3_RAMVA|nr:hypothetical protein RvY_10504-2 [Ramazzottius varieornatus]
MPRAFLFSSKRYGLVRKSVPFCSGFESALIPSGKVSPKCSPCTGSSEVALNLSCSQVALKQPVEPSLPVTAPSVQPVFDSAQVSATYAHTSPASQNRPRRKRLQPSPISASPDSRVSNAKTPRPIRTKRTKRNLVEEGDFVVSEEPELKDGPKEEHHDSSSHDTGCSESHFACPECGKVYTTASNLTRHRQTHRSLSDQKARKCPHCDRVYVSSPAYNMHVQTHLQSCECPHCKKRFSRQWLLQWFIVVGPS